ncbi:MAG: hypothetical protein KDD62_15145 [Bdellovibrionales bacterium]|nr:hypothetical protein [Bdellovibrionales bacterium]
MGRGQLYGLLAKGSSESDIANQLKFIEAEYMGLNPVDGRQGSALARLRSQFDVCLNG